MEDYNSNVKTDWNDYYNLHSNSVRYFEAINPVYTLILEQTGDTASGLGYAATYAWIYSIIVLIIVGFVLLLFKEKKPKDIKDRKRQEKKLAKLEKQQMKRLKKQNRYAKKEAKKYGK